MADKGELVIAALKEQIANQALEIAVYRADITILTNEKTAKDKELAEYSSSLTKE